MKSEKPDAGRPAGPSSVATRRGVDSSNVSSDLPPGRTAARSEDDLALRERELFNAAFKEPFRGTIWENCASAPMGKGHNNDGRPFDLETACYLKPVLEAIQNPWVRKVVIKAGVKTLKSFMVEISAAYHLCHSIGDVTIYFGTGEQADDQSTTRILDYFAGIPSYREKMASISGQWDMTQSAVKFPDKTFRIKPANLANTQGVNLGFVGVCDAFVTEATGMIDQAIERTTQYPHDKKIILESQGGEKHFDFDRHYEDTDQRELHVLCPGCGVSHVFNWKAFDEESMTRPQEFQARLPRERVREILAKYHCEDQLEEVMAWQGGEPPLADN